MDEQAILARLQELDARVTAIEGRVGSLEDQTATTLKHFGDYKTRTSEELKLMQDQVESLLASVEALVDHAENDEMRDRAISLRRRLRNNRTRIDKALVARA